MQNLSWKISRLHLGSLDSTYLSLKMYKQMYEKEWGYDAICGFEHVKQTKDGLVTSALGGGRKNTLPYNG